MLQVPDCNSYAGKILKNHVTMVIFHLLNYSFKTDGPEGPKYQ